MFRKLLLSISLVLLISVGPVQAAPWPLEIIDHLDETKIVIFVNESDIEAAPKWNPDDGAPAFGLKEVLDSVNRWRQENNCSNQDSIEKIELKPIAHHEKQGRWYYLVQLKNVKKSAHAHRFLAILMNGKTAAAMMEPEALK